MAKIALCIDFFPQSSFLNWGINPYIRLQELHKSVWALKHVATSRCVWECNDQTLNKNQTWSEGKVCLLQPLTQFLVHQSLGCERVRFCFANDVIPHSVSACCLKHRSSDWGLLYNKYCNVCHGCTKCSAFIETKWISCGNRFSIAHHHA